jgi:hypothetical protein
MELVIIDGRWAMKLLDVIHSYAIAMEKEGIDCGSPELACLLAMREQYKELGTYDEDQIPMIEKFAAPLVAQVVERDSQSFIKKYLIPNRN